MLLTGILLADVDVLEEQFATFTEHGWVIPAWLVYLRTEVIKRDAPVLTEIYEGPVPS